MYNDNKEVLQNGKENRTFIYSVIMLCLGLWVLSNLIIDYNNGSLAWYRYITGTIWVYILWDSTGRLHKTIVG